MRTILTLFLSNIFVFALDLNENQLDDLWERSYNADGLVATEDNDGDGYDNLEECLAGTNPLDPNDYIQTEDFEFDPSQNEINITWKSQQGKVYRVLQGSEFPLSPIGPELIGNGGEFTMTFCDDQPPKINQGVKLEQWRATDELSLSSLADGAEPAELIKGTRYLPRFSIPNRKSAHTLGKLTAILSPEATGAYTFYLNSDSVAEVYLSSDSSASNGAKVCEVLPTERDSALNEWVKYPNQSSAAINLIAGQKYSLEVRYLQDLPHSFLQVGWVRPGQTDIEVITSNDIESEQSGEALDLDEIKNNFFRVTVRDNDQDNDGISDWAEQKLEAHLELDFNDSQTNGTLSDASEVTAFLTNNAPAVPEVQLQASDVCAYENNFPFSAPDYAEITLTRTGIIPFSVQLEAMGAENTGDTAVVCDGTCCKVVGTAGDEMAEKADYLYLDANGNELSEISFELGETEKKIKIKAIRDSIFEYPETLNLKISAASNGEYTLSETNGATVQLLDAPDEPENDIIFIGSFSKDGNAVTETNGSGTVTMRLNGSRTKALLWTQFENLTSEQQDCHIHKFNPGNTAGSIVYAVTETPYDEETDPLNGPLFEYPWDLSNSHFNGVIPTSGGSPTKQKAIDSLFSQNGETPLYLNIHTVDNAAGEIWAALIPSEGSQTAPAPPEAIANPGSETFPLLAGLPLEKEIRRFLNQATFGATDEDVAALKTKIETNRLTNAQYHRISAFEDWIDEQVALPQTYILDLALASQMQSYYAIGYFDPIYNPSVDGITPPPLPTNWPTVDRSNPDFAKWNFSQPYPMDRNQQRLGDSTNSLSIPSKNINRHAKWETMLNAKDQLRHKMGFAFQQIITVSEADTSNLGRYFFAYPNFLDELYSNVFGHYREMLGDANKNPMMGRWLSSLQNQKAADLDGDGEFDIFPDENLARENMQLFSIGLFELWEDGSLRLDQNGLPIPTYTNADIREFAKVLTGQTYAKNNNGNNPTLWGGVPYDSLPDNNSFTRNSNNAYFGITDLYPMVMWADFHDATAKTIVGGRVIDNRGLSPQEQADRDLEDAMDWLAGVPADDLPDFDMVHSHRSTPAFISKRLIKRLVTSNPSQEYLHRVAYTFKETSGDLLATTKAILLDPAARIPISSDKTFGMKKSPLEAYIQMMRSLDAHSLIPLKTPEESEYPFNIVSYPTDNPFLPLSAFDYPQTENFRLNSRYLFRSVSSSGTSSLQMDPAEQQTVFNWYLADYAPGGIISATGLVSPELQLANDSDIIRNINFFNSTVRKWTTDPEGKRGLSVEELGNSDFVQSRMFGNSEGGNNADWVRVDLEEIARTLYPSTPPTEQARRSSESLADEALLDALDLRLTNGEFKEKYPYDASDNDDPNIEGVDDFLKNPREAIIDAITAWNDPYNPNDTPEEQLNDRRQKVGDAIYLLTLTPEYLVKK